MTRYFEAKGSKAKKFESEGFKPEGFAELSCMSNFSFLRGTSHPEELVVVAKKIRALWLGPNRSQFGCRGGARPYGGKRSRT